MTELTIDQVRNLLSETVPGTDWREISEDESLADAGLDSLDKATFIMKVEERFGSSIPDDAYENIDSVAGLIGYVKQSV